MHYVDQVNGVDSTMTNENPLIQHNTGYRQLDILQKIRYRSFPVCGLDPESAVFHLLGY